MIGACLLAVLSLPYGYYQLLRIVVTGYAAYQALRFFISGSSSWPWAFVFVALLYNPVFVIVMSKGVHSIVNVITAGLFWYDFHVLQSAADHDAVDGGTTTTVALPLNKLPDMPLSSLPDRMHRIFEAIAVTIVIMLCIVFLVFALAWSAERYLR
jgi:hypothetical protein